MDLLHIDELLFKDFNADFLKRAEGDVHFICKDGKKITEMIEKVIESQKRVNQSIEVLAYVPEKFKSEPVEWGSGAPGIHPNIARYLASMEVVAVGADTWSLDVVPPMIANEPYPSHGILLQ